MTSQAVATNPRSTSTSSLPFQNESSLSSIAIEPSLRALLGDPPVHRQGTEEGQQHDGKG